MRLFNRRVITALMVLTTALASNVDAAGLPDLKITDIRLYAGEVQPGQPITIETTLVNKGTAKAPASVTGLYLSVDKNLAPHQDHLIGSQTVTSGLAPGQRVTQWSTVYVPPDFAPGSHHLGGVADLTKRVHEANESNNKILSAIREATNKAINYACSIQQGFDFRKDSQSCVGFVTQLSIGGTSLANDLQTTNPLDLSDKPRVVGVLSNLTLGNTTTDPLYLGFVVSEANQRAITTMLHSEWTNTEVVIAITIDAYDPVTKAYYPSLYMLNTSLQGLIAKDDNLYVLGVDTQPYPNQTSPKLYMARLGVTPEGCQPFGIAASVNSRYTVPWGCPAP